ncbi:MAG: hypothetical protein KAT28_03275 [Candidatus Aenigmarchaeota archaeon]|nr:hypothetical protein [Candidatus Aenigmarchaeota archaeon]
MKKIILCEGKQDMTFYKELFSKLKLKTKTYTIFDANNCKSNKYKAEETKAIRNLGHTSKNILIKAEKGGNLVKVYPYLISLIDDDIKTILSIDLDIKNTREKFMVYLRKNFTSKNITLTCSNIKEKTNLISWDILIKHNKTYLGNTSVIAFNSSLEKVAGIKRYPEGAVKIRNKSAKLLKEKEIFESFKNILN